MLTPRRKVFDERTNGSGGVQCPLGITFLFLCICMHIVCTRTDAERWPPVARERPDINTCPSHGRLYDLAPRSLTAYVCVYVYVTYMCCTAASGL